MNTELISNFRHIILIAMTYTQHSHDYFKKKCDDPSIAIAYLNIAASKFATAEAIYYSRIEDLQSKEAEALFHHFYVYSKEFLENFATDHSHQWTDFEYDRLKECFDHSAFAPKNE